MKGKLRNVVGSIKSTGYSHNKTNMNAFTFTATVASRSYHVYKQHLEQMQKFEIKLQ